MNKRRLSILVNSFLVIFFILLTLSFFFDMPRTYIEGLLIGNKITTGVVYVLIVILTTVFAPLAGLPFTPIVSVIVGPFITSLYNIFGWTVGAIIIFFITRYLARPILRRFIDMNKIDKYEEYIPERYIFLWLVFLRIIVPVDILSYAIGLTRRVQFPMYITSTFIGVIPFSFIWAYGGYSLIKQDYMTFSIFSGIGLLLFFLSMAYYSVYTKNRKNK